MRYFSYLSFEGRCFMGAYVVRKIESMSSDVPDSLGIVSRVVEGVILADSPPKTADLLGGEFQGEGREAWIVFIPEAMLVPPNPGFAKGDPLHGVSWYKKGDISISHRKRGGLTLCLTLAPLLQDTVRVGTA
jgi:hypothetical protein